LRQRRSWRSNQKRREVYRLNEILIDEIVMGGNTVVIGGEEVA